MASARCSVTVARSLAVDGDGDGDGDGPVWTARAPKVSPAHAGLVTGCGEGDGDAAGRIRTVSPARGPPLAAIRSDTPQAPTPAAASDAPTAALRRWM